MSKKVKIAGVQMEPKIREKEKNLEKCLELIRVSAKEGANLIVFPECALTGYIFNSLEEAIPFAEPVPGPSTDRIITVCHQMHIYTVIGLLELDGHKCYNTAVLVGPQGIVGKHRKVHLPCVGIDRFVSHGDIPFTVYDTELGRIGMGICYDGLFPEHGRVLALKGADIIVLPANWPEMSQGFPKYIIPARAIENHIFYAGVNRVGKERGSTFFGRSRIAYWLGILADGKPYEEDILYAEIEPEAAREKHLVAAPGQMEVNVIRDRRPEFYTLVTQPQADGSKTR